MKKNFDLGLYLVTDDSAKKHFGLLETVEAAVAGGATIVQYRSDNPDAGTCYAEALQLAEFLRSRGVPFIVNNRVDLALAVDADGVHVGQSDLPVHVVRKLIGTGKILGFSVSNRAELDAADFSVVDYLGIGPVFPTATKKDAAPALGVENFAALVQRSPVPVVAIGGIDLARSRVLRDAAPSAGIAVVSAICSAENPELAARALCAKAG